MTIAPFSAFSPGQPLAAGAQPAPAAAAGFDAALQGALQGTPTLPGQSVPTIAGALPTTDTATPSTEVPFAKAPDTATPLVPTTGASLPAAEPSATAPLPIASTPAPDTAWPTSGPIAAGTPATDPPVLARPDVAPSRTPILAPAPEAPPGTPVIGSDPPTIAPSEKASVGDSGSPPVAIKPDHHVAGAIHDHVALPATVPAPPQAAPKDAVVPPDTGAATATPANPATADHDAPKRPATGKGDDAARTDRSPDAAVLPVTLAPAAITPAGPATITPTVAVDRAQPAMPGSDGAVPTAAVAAAAPHPGHDDAITAPAHAPAAATGFADALAQTTPAPHPAAADAGTATLPITAHTTAAPPAAVATPTAGAATPTIPAQPGRVGHDMGVAIAHRILDGGHELTVRLSPEHMGRVEVTMAFDDRGTLRATVAAEHGAALDLLRRDSADLHRSLADAGIRADAQSLRFDTRTADGGGSGGQQPRPRPDDGQPAASTRRFYADAPVADAVPFRSLRTSGRLDLMA